MCKFMTAAFLTIISLMCLPKELGKKYLLKRKGSVLPSIQVMLSCDGALKRNGQVMIERTLQGAAVDDLTNEISHREF